MQNKMQKGYGIPVAIIIAGLLIGSAVFLSSDGNVGGTGQNVAGNNQMANHQQIDDFRIPNEDDHVLGNLDAKVAIVEFSDFECPFCARLHPTLSRIVEENSEVKWVYRHFPLSRSHPRALGAAVASECVAKLGGNNAFWEFTDKLFTDQHQLGSSLYEELANEIGLESSAFQSCLSDKSIEDLVAQDGNEAVQTGGRGTPFSVIVTADGKLMPFSGALPYEQIASLVDQALIN
jgi:protein-disulfide isomerase